MPFRRIIATAALDANRFESTEKCQVYKRGKDHRQEIEKKVFKEWQNRWDRAEGEPGGWTKRLIPDLQKVVNRKHGETNYYVTQMLSEHENFAKQRQRILVGV